MNSKINNNKLKSDIIHEEEFMELKHLKYLLREKNVITVEGKEVIIYKLIIDNDDDILWSWAKHLREHYCSESEIDLLRVGYNLSRKEYLNQIKLPDARGLLGPSVRSGDFTEILVADYVQYVLNYYVPRTRYDRKVNRNSSTMGSDLIGYKCGERVNSNDELIIFEVKAAASETPPPSRKDVQKAKNESKPSPIRLQRAIDDSNKDILRLAESLNAIVQRLIDKQDYEGVKKVQRFQNSTDTPYGKVYAAAAVHSDTSYSEELLKTISTIHHIDPNLMLIVIHCDKLMQFIHSMYWRALEC